MEAHRVFRVGGDVGVLVVEVHRGYPSLQILLCGVPYHLVTVGTVTACLKVYGVGRVARAQCELAGDDAFLVLHAFLEVCDYLIKPTVDILAPCRSGKEEHAPVVHHAALAGVLHRAVRLRAVYVYIHVGRGVGSRVVVEEFHIEQSLVPSAAYVKLIRRVWHDCKWQNPVLVGVKTLEIEVDDVEVGVLSGRHVACLRGERVEVLG